jgi:hypothetical protein
MGDDPVPAIPDYGLGNSINVGTSFNARQDALVTGVRFWKPATSAGPYIGTLYDGERRQLASVEFGTPDVEGWIVARFTAPVPVDMGKTYVVSVFLPKGHWPVTLRYFEDSGPRVVGPVTETHGVVLYWREVAYPASTTSDFLFVDPLFSSVQEPIEPTASPAPGLGATPEVAGMTAVLRQRQLFIVSDLISFARTLVVDYKTSVDVGRDDVDLSLTSSHTVGTRRR